MSPHTKGKQQAAVTLRKTTGEKKKTATITTKKSLGHAQAKRALNSGTKGALSF